MRQHEVRALRVAQGHADVQDDAAVAGAKLHTGATYLGRAAVDGEVHGYLYVFML